MDCIHLVFIGLPKKREAAGWRICVHLRTLLTFSKCANGDSLSFERSTYSYLQYYYV